MGKIYIVRFEDGTSRDLASMGMGHAKLFYELAGLIEREFVHLPSGIADDVGPCGPQDEHVVDPDAFIRFFEKFWKEGWLGEKRGGLLHDWAQEAAGIIENITLTPKEWVDRNGEVLEVSRYLRWEEFVARQAAQGVHIPPFRRRPPDGTV